MVSIGFFWRRWDGVKVVPIYEEWDGSAWIEWSSFIILGNIGMSEHLHFLAVTHLSKRCQEKEELDNTSIKAVAVLMSPLIDIVS